jgi:ParB family transcriptional regulator, chromosome partitioning protein
MSKLGDLSSISAKLKNSAKKKADHDVNRIENIACKLIDPNPKQPRKHFAPAPLQELADSIKVHGVMQPITLRKKPNGRYEIIAGERRWRATTLAALDNIPARIIEADDAGMHAMALIENIQRENLSALDEADSVAQLVAALGTQQSAAAVLGKDKEYVSKMCTVALLPELARTANASELLGDDAEVLANIARLHKLNPDYSAAIIGFAKKPGDITRQYSRIMLKRAKENQQAPISPAEWLSLINSAEQRENSTTSNSSKNNAPAETPLPLAHPRDSEYGFAELKPGQVTIEVSIESMRIRKAVVNLERLPEKPGFIWVIHENSHIRAEVDEVKILRVIAKR